MVKGVKKVEDAKGLYVDIRVSIPKKTYKAVKIKCALLDISVKKCMTDLVNKMVKDVERDIVDKYPKG
ncbi:unnamed protein product [marine sediment metagenome]|uniref:Uncharacterized protein n=1 Tax=marine sediment metagenome TaxID=412755 RepID=X1F4G6_9ZZZZ